MISARCALPWEVDGSPLPRRRACGVACRSWRRLRCRGWAGLPVFSDLGVRCADPDLLRVRQLHERSASQARKARGSRRTLRAATADNAAPIAARHKKPGPEARFLGRESLPTRLAFGVGLGGSLGPDGQASEARPLGRPPPMARRFAQSALFARRAESARFGNRVGSDGGARSGVSPRFQLRPKCSSPQLGSLLSPAPP